MIASGECTAIDWRAKVGDPLAWIEKMGEHFERSQMFGCKEKGQGAILAYQCFAANIPPAQIAERYNLIHGRLNLGADAMLADFRALGGTYEIVERSFSRAAIRMQYAGNDELFEFTKEDCFAEPLPYEGKEKEILAKLASGKTGELKIKGKYATPRSRMQMLWARVVSDAVRAMAPEVVAGKYTPEEVQDFAGVTRDTSSDTASNTASDGNSRCDSVQGGETVATELVAGSQATEQSPPAQTLESVPKYLDANLINQINDLFLELQVPADAQRSILAKRKVRSVSELSVRQAADLIDALTAKLPAKEPEYVYDSDPCTPELEQEIRKRLGEVAQVEGFSDVVTRIRERLASAGLAKFRDLSVSEAEALISSLKLKELAIFIELDLRGHAQASGE